MSPEQSAKLLEFYQNDPLFTTMSKVAALKLLPLDFTSGATFRQLVSTYEG